MAEENTPIETTDVLDGFVIPEDFELPADESADSNADNNIDQPSNNLEQNSNDLESPESVDDPVFTDEPTVVTDDPINPEEKTNDNEDNLFSVLAETLKDDGFFKNLESTDSIKDVDALSKAFKDEIKANEYSDLNDNQKRVLEAFRDGVPSEDILKHESTQSYFNNITEEAISENEELRKNIIINDLLSKGISQARAEKTYSAIYDAGEDNEEALESLNNLKAAEQAEYDNYIKSINANKAKEQKERDAQFNKLKETIESTDKFLGEISVTDNMRENVVKTMSVPVDYLEDGTPVNKLMKARMDDPITFENNLYYLFELTNGFKDLKVFSKKATTKATKKLSEVIGNSTYIRSDGKPTFQKDPDSYQSLIVELI